MGVAPVAYTLTNCGDSRQIFLFLDASLSKGADSSASFEERWVVFDGNGDGTFEAVRGVAESLPPTVCGNALPLKSSRVSSALTVLRTMVSLQ